MSDYYEQKIGELEDTIAELREDKRRLDWLENNFDHNLCLVLNQETPWLITVEDNMGDRSVLGETLRQAIDKAMEE